MPESAPIATPAAVALADGLRLAIRLTPKASRARIDGPRATPGGSVFAVAVTAPPEDGKANAALIALLAARLRVAKSAVRLTQGGKSRNKTVIIEGDPADPGRRLADVLKDESHG